MFKFNVIHVWGGMNALLFSFLLGCGKTPGRPTAADAVQAVEAQAISPKKMSQVSNGWAKDVELLDGVQLPESEATAGSVGSRADIPTPKAGTSANPIYELLDRIREKTRDEHPFLEDRTVRQLDQSVKSWQPSDGLVKKWQLQTILGMREVVLGNEQTGVEQLKQGYDLLPLVRVQIESRYAHETIFQLAVACLRVGETQNCCVRNTPDSCIVPLRGDGIHTRPAGSTVAIRYLLELLEDPSLNAERAVTTKWLLNIAYMTLGKYPDEVPRKHLLPQDTFKSGSPFPRFVNIAPKLGLGTFNLCGGAVVDDFNGDGYLDIFTTTWDTSGEPHLFIHDGNGSFEDRTREAGLSGLYGGLNTIQADYDNDGDVDILILRGAWLGQHGRYPNSLLANDGNGNFMDVTFQAGLGEVHYPTHSAAFSDYDNDGDLDIYIGNESSAEIEAPGQLFRNNGDGTFTDVAAEAGVQNLRFAKGVVWGDYDGDRYPDLYVSNYGDPNRLYHNNRDGTFTDVATTELQKPLNSFPCWFWDFDNDGALDIFVSSYSSRMDAVANYYFGRTMDFERPCLFRGDGKGGFEDVTAKSGLSRPMLPMGANFGDINNDGYLDFYLGTGDPDYFSLMPNLCFVSREGQSFEDVTMAAGLGHLQKGHGVSFADLDNDGDLDIFEQMGGAFRGDAFNDVLYENPGFGSHWLAVELVGKRSNRSAIGARLRAEVVRSDGSVRSIYRHVNSGGSFGANPLRQTIGLGENGTVRTLEVLWPTTNETQHFQNVSANQLIRITEGERDYSVQHLKKLTLH